MQLASASAPQRAHSSPPALQSPPRQRSPDDDADLYVPLPFARRAVSAASLDVTTAAIGSSYQSAAPVSNSAARLGSFGLSTYNAPSLTGKPDSKSHATTLDVDEEVYDVPDDVTGTKAKAR